MKGPNITNLIVRTIELIFKAVKKRATAHGVSTKSIKRKTLEHVLIQPQQQSFVEVLLQIPNVGEDEDFKRIQAEIASDVFN